MRLAPRRQAQRPSNLQSRSMAVARQILLRLEMQVPEIVNCAYWAIAGRIRRDAPPLFDISYKA